MKAVRDGESKKAFLKNTKFIIDGMLSNNYDLEEENFELKYQLQAYKQKEDELIKWCYEHGQAINATDILDIIDPTILEGDK